MGVSFKKGTLMLERFSLWAVKMEAMNCADQWWSPVRELKHGEV